MTTLCTLRIRELYYNNKLQFHKNSPLQILRSKKNDGNFLYIFIVRKITHTVLEHHDQSNYYLNDK